MKIHTSRRRGIFGAITLALIALAFLGMPRSAYADDKYGPETQCWNGTPNPCYQVVVNTCASYATTSVGGGLTVGPTGGGVNASAGSVCSAWVTTTAFYQWKTEAGAGGSGSIPGPKTQLK